MHAFVIGMNNRPGALADALETLAAAGVNLATGGAATWGDSGAAAVVTADGAAAAAALDGAGVAYRQLGIAVASIENRPGTLAAAARALSDAGINIEGLVPMGMDGGRVQVGFAVADTAAAQAALG